MRLYFKPYPWLTGFTIVSLGILIGLGYWQSQRLVWKTNLLAEVAQAASAEPFNSLSEVDTALSQGVPVDFRRIKLSGLQIGGQTPFLVYSRHKQALSWRPYLVIESQGSRVFFTRPSILDSDRERYLLQSVEEKPVTLVGYIRLARGPVRGEAKSTPALNRWFSFNPMPELYDWGTQIASGTTRDKVTTQFYIETETFAGNAKDLPIKRPDIRNNHFDYMLTWYGLALCLLIIYLLLHKRGGRLGLQKSDLGQ